MTRRLLASLAVTALAFALAAQAADLIPKVTRPGDSKSQVPELTPEQLAQQQKEAEIKQDQLKRQFDEFKQSLLRLAHRLESSTKQEDKDKAAILKEAIKTASEVGVDNKFATLIAGLKTANSFKDLDQLQTMMDKNLDLRNDIRKLIELLLRDDRDSKLREDRMATERLLERLKELIAKQERVRAQTEQGRKDAAELKKAQDNVTKETKDLIDPKASKGQEAKPKGEAKPSAENKSYGKAEAKYDTKENKGEGRDKDGKSTESKEGKDDKPGESKEGKPNEKEGKPGESKEGKEGKDGKPAEAKEGKSENKEGKPGEGKEGKDSKEGKPGEGKEGKPGESKEGKGGEGKDAKPSESKEGKPGEGKEGKPGEGKDGKPGEGKEGKPGEGKDGKGGEGKEGKPGEGKEGKPGEGKDGKGGEGKEGKPGEGKEGKSGEGKEGKGGEAKPSGSQPGESKESKPGQGEGKPAQGKEGGQPKDGKPGEGKGGEGKEGKDGKPGEGKPGQSGSGQPKEAKPGEGKPGQGKPGEGKPGEGKQGQPGSGKPGEGKESKPGQGEGKPGQGKEGGKPGEGKPGEGKPGQGKGGESKEGKPGEGKAGSESKGKESGKAESKGGESKPGSPGGKPSEGKPGQGKPGEGKPGQGQPGQPKDDPQGGQGGKGGQPPPDQQAEQNPVKKQIKDSNKYQESAGKNIEAKKNKEASEDQDEAIKQLEIAKKALEDLLKQMREEEIERLLARLQGRCELMLAMQIGVRDGTVNVNDKIKDRKLTDEERRGAEQDANIQSDKEDEIVREANLAIRLIEAEGSAIAFAEVFKQVRTDMVNVAVRLRKTDVGTVTITIENDIIATLTEMVDALKKARQENEQKSKPGQPKPPGAQGPPQDQKLIDMIAELKMIRSMQERVNKRTQVYGQEYKGEQAPTPNDGKTADEREKYERIQKELKDLGQREEKIGKVTGDIAKGKNKAN